MTDLVIYGTGGFAREVLQVVLDLNEERPRWNILGWLDDDTKRWGVALHDLPVLGNAAWVMARPEVHAVIGIGNPAVRRRVARRLDGQPWATLVHPRAWLGRRVRIGSGTVVCAGALVTTDVRLGAHVILNLGVTVGHDTVVEDFVTINPLVAVSGGVRVGEGADVGTGSAIVQGVSIGAWSVVGAGAAVARALPANVTAVGVPARVIKERPEGWHSPSP